MRRFGGSVTVFLALALTSMMALTGGLFESARAAGQNAYVQTALDSSLESVMSGYHREVFDQYRIFVLEADTPDDIREMMEPYLDAYFDETKFYPFAGKELRVSEPVRITDEEGRYFDDEAVSYMKFGLLPALASPESFGETAEETDQNKSFGMVTEDFKVSGRGVLRLEKAADKIYDALARKRHLMEEGDAALREADGGYFRRRTEALKRELGNFPDLVRQYDEAADALGEEIRAAEEKSEAERDRLSEAGSQAVEERLREYHSYTDADGTRRKQMHTYADEAAADLVTADEALARADEVEEIIASWEDDEEDDGGDDDEDDEDEEDDEEELWRTVLSITARYHRESPGKAKRDRQKMDLLETLSGLADSAILALCVPKEMTVSEGQTVLSGFPSACAGTSPGEARSSAPGGGIADLPSRLLFDEYGIHFFDNFRTAKEDKSFRYELEYLLYGREKDRENLTRTVMSLFAVREGANLLLLLGDEEKKAEARAAAAAIAGAAGPLSVVVYSMILTVWASLESISDVRILLSGGKIPPVKGTDDWKVSLSGFLSQGLGVLDGISAEEDTRGMDYEAWLRIFLLLTDRRTLRYRMMDMIQENITREEPGFQMDKCIYRVEASVSCRGVLVPVEKKAVREYR